MKIYYCIEQKFSLKMYLNQQNKLVNVHFVKESIIKNNNKFMLNIFLKKKSQVKT